MPASPAKPAYLRGARVVEERVPADDHYPFALPFVRDLDITLDTPVTFFVGETRSGKSTLLEAIASLVGFPASGGGKEDLADMGHRPESSAPLAAALRPSFVVCPRDGFFFRAELLAHFAEVLEERDRDPDFPDSPYARYGG